MTFFRSPPPLHSYVVSVLPGSICLQMMLQRKQRVEWIYLSLASVFTKYYFVRRSAKRRGAWLFAKLKPGRTRKRINAT